MLWSSFHTNEISHMPQWLVRFEYIAFLLLLICFPNSKFQVIDLLAAMVKTYIDIYLFIYLLPHRWDDPSAERAVDGCLLFVEKN